MKKALLGLGILMLISSCDIIYVEETPYDSRDLFTGRFEAEEYSETVDQYTVYDIRVTKANNTHSSVVYIDNFYGVGIEIFGEVYGDELTIPRQRINGYVIQGVGHMDYGDLVMTYSVEDIRSGGFTDFCNTVAYQR